MSSQNTIYKAVIYADPGTTKTEIVECELEKPGPGQVLVKIMYSGVCHTDYAICMNALGGITPKGQIGGHEGIGEVVQLGPGVKYPGIGKKVGIKWAADACLDCDRCLAGGETSCTSGKISGLFTPGTFQQYCISWANYVTPIPDNIDLAGAAPLMCGGITVYKALKTAELKQGDWVLISGAGGGLGHLAIQYGKAVGARVVALDTGSKKNFCLQLGADIFIDFTKYPEDQGLTDEVQKVTGGGAKAVICCASSNKAYSQSISFLGFRGTLFCVGVPEGDILPISGARADSLVALELGIKGLKAGNRQEAIECLELVSKGLIKTHYQLRNMSDLTEVFEEMKAGTTEGRFVLDLR